MDVINPKTGVKLVGKNAPLRSELASWLSAHPGWRPDPTRPSTQSAADDSVGSRHGSRLSNREQLMKDAQEKANDLWQRTVTSAARRVRSIV